MRNIATPLATVPLISAAGISCRILPNRRRLKLAAIGLYVLTYLYPLYLGRIRGYDSMMIGETLFISGLCMFLTAPLAGFLSGKMDLRVMMMIELLGFAAGARSMLMKKPARAAAGGGGH